MSDFYIYALCDPDTKRVRYIGQSANPEKRFVTHAQVSGSKVMRNWVGKLKSEGKKPSLVVLESVSESDKLKRERWWIEHYIERGEVLLNSTHNPLYPRGKGKGREWKWNREWTS